MLTIKIMLVGLMLMLIAMIRPGNMDTFDKTVFALGAVVVVLGVGLSDKKENRP